MDNTVRWLEQIGERAAASLKEGLEETLAVVKLVLPDLLRRTFSTTNPIESILDGVRYCTHRVKRGPKGQMVARWESSALIVVEKSCTRWRERLSSVASSKLWRKFDELMKGVRNVGRLALRETD